MLVGQESGEDAGFTDREKVIISRALGIDSRLCECELYCFAINRKVVRGERVVQRNDVVKAWDSIPRKSNSFRERNTLVLVAHLLCSLVLAHDPPLGY